MTSIAHKVNFRLLPYISLAIKIMIFNDFRKNGLREHNTVEWP